MEKIQIHIRLHPKKHKDLKILAAEEGKSINDMIGLSISMLLASHGNTDFKKFLKEYFKKNDI